MLADSFHLPRGCTTSSTAPSTGHYSAFARVSHLGIESVEAAWEERVSHSERVTGSHVVLSRSASSAKEATMTFSVQPALPANTGTTTQLVFAQSSGEHRTVRTTEHQTKELSRTFKLQNTLKVLVNTGPLVNTQRTA